MRVDDVWHWFSIICRLNEFALIHCEMHRQAVRPCRMVCFYPFLDTKKPNTRNGIRLGCWAWFKEHYFTCAWMALTTSAPRACDPAGVKWTLAG